MYIDDDLSINNQNFTNCILLINIHVLPKELEIKETTETASSASFLDIYFIFDIRANGKLSTRLYDKSDGFNIASFDQFRTYINSWCVGINAVVLNVDANLCCL